MYEKTYHLKNRPFSAAPNLLQYHPAEAAETALRNCRAAIDRQAGPAMILGAAGMGKTLLLDLLADSYGGQYQVVTIACARTDTRKDLLQNILFQLGQTYRDLSESELRLELADYLRPGPHCPQGLLCLVDDAHCLAEDLLDELRVLSGFTRAGQLRCQMILTGTQRLEELLFSPRQESFSQKISARSYLAPLNQTETAEYVRAHLRRAGGGNREFFTPDALKQAHRLSQGVPRLLNQLCDAALQRCATQGMATVTTELCQQSWAELQRLPLEDYPPANGFSQAQPAIFPTRLETTTGGGIEFGILSDELGEMPLESPKYTRDEMACEGRASGKQFSQEIPVAEKPVSVEHAFGTQSPLSNAIKATELEGALLHGRGIESPRGTQAASARRTPPVPQATRNPFEESFETEEVVTEAFLRGAIAHNQGASELTRAVLDEFRVDALEVRTRNPLESTPASRQSPLASEGSASGRKTDISLNHPEQVTLPFPAGFESHAEHAGQVAFRGGPNAEAATKKDDRDMLIVSKLNQLVTPPAIQSEAEDHSAIISTGRAYRMDYQQLFSRLRNALTPPTGETNTSR